ncbi:5-amino-6-(5-phospho-D-ribitylamino)uracil phosphatase YigB [Vibrio sp. JC009]|uniref:5-amino-6-(5-phospho-D-ribitylamino)uracil phosphatase YigB n=1 Tax=Vibrio sp. JC009 TaxID=2912314 RepID=UPI0023B00BAC|nr:5-amino-6-(5-phospho-D-ribitylamino)uracil phosphatase YigB [Vibrio sp. JC009]WED21777.1 5-amino-6-(5-phospho-D-ribitylamino)uracil phosphatase YigB [Vibrio sp. JC009]
MLIYRSPKPVKAMTFDLDDTLYDNKPVIQNVEREMVKWLHTHHPVSSTIPVTHWQQIKREIALANPEICHDVTLWRQTQIQEGLTRLGYAQEQAENAAKDGIEHALWLRNQVDVPCETHEVMEKLASKIPLIAITNGNVDPEKIGIAHYFRQVYKAGPDGKAKPFSDMFDLSAAHLKINRENILHVGDHLRTDVCGAKNAGFQACWTNYSGQTIRDTKKARILPDIEICDLSELLALV